MQAAKKLHCSRTMIYKLVDYGELSHHRVGRTIRIFEYSIQKYIEKNTKNFT